MITGWLTTGAGGAGLVVAGAGGAGFVVAGAVAGAVSTGGATTGAEQDMFLPARFALLQNAPNPFNPVTVIRYELPVPTHVRIDVYTVSGRLVRTVADEYREAGYGRVVWDGTDATGRKVASGIYVYGMRAGGFTSRKRMVLLK